MALLSLMVEGPIMGSQSSHPRSLLVDRRIGRSRRRTLSGRVRSVVWHGLLLIDAAGNAHRLVVRGTLEGQGGVLGRGRQSWRVSRAISWYYPCGLSKQALSPVLCHSPRHGFPCQYQALGIGVRARGGDWSRYRGTLGICFLFPRPDLLPESVGAVRPKSAAA